MRILKMRTRLFVFILSLLGSSMAYSQNITINEINYISIDDRNVEFVELYNNESTAVDISGWSLSKGIEFTFPAGTIIAANGYTVVAAEPADVNSIFGHTILGHFIGKLSNSGDEVRLLDKDCLEIDKVEYDAWKEWPAVRLRDPAQYSFELRDSHGGGWDGASLKVVVNGQTQATYTVTGSSAFHNMSFNDGDVVEIIYSPGNFEAENTYFIRDSKNVTVFSDGPNPGPGTIFIAEGNKKFVSLQKLNPLLPSNQPGSWSSNYPTPGTQNFAVYMSDPSQVAVLKNISKSPDNPMIGEDVRIKADFSQNENVFLGSVNVFLEYQVNTPGNYVTKDAIGWTQVTMLDDGIGADSTANNAVYTAKIPGNLNNHRNLIRYRVRVSSPNGADKIFPDPHFKESNYAYYMYDKYPNVNNHDINSLVTLPDVTIITTEAISDEFIGSSDGNNTATSQYQGGSLAGKGTLVYNGKVFDHINFRPRGKGSRLVRDKPGIKVGLNKEHPATIKSDCGDSYDVKRDKLVFSGGWVNDVAAQGLTESIIYKVSELAGGLPRYTDYVQLRIVNSSTETGNDKGDFFGLYLLMEDYNGDYLEEHDFADGNFWGTNRLTRQRFLDYEGDFPNAATIGTFAPSTQTNGSFTITDRGHKPLLFGDRIAAEIYGLNGNNYIGKHSYNEYYDSATDHFLGWWGDYDNTFGSPYDDVTVFPRSDSKIDAVNAGNMIIPSSMQVQYQNSFRSTYDLLLDYTDPDCNCTQSDYLVDQEALKIYNPTSANNWVDVDKSRWPQISYDLGSYAAQRNWYKSWFQNRKAYLKPNFDDIEIPSKPTISMIGSLALDNLVFQNSSFSDINGSGTFQAMEWRVGEWSDPSNPYYDQTCDPKYEIETKWSSGEITSFSSSYQIPAEAKLKEDRTYLIRVRYKDNTGRWSHWSNPQKIIPVPAANPIQYDLVINEIMYNPNEPDQAEFIELYNASDLTIDLNNVQFNEGIDFEFKNGSSIGPESYICIAKDSASFFKAYGYYPFDDYGGGLSNSGELVRLVGPFRSIIDTVRYDDDVPWPGTPDKGHYSLALKSPTLDNGVGSNWDIQALFTTPCAPNQFNDYGTHAYSGIVINEIHYNPFDEIDANGNEIESGTKFEFVELKNISNSDIDMTGSFFSRGIEYYFEDNTIIGPGEFFVLAEDKSSFEDRYGFPPHGKYDGKLSNTGETLWLVKENGLIQDELTYSTSFPWDSEANNGNNDFSLAAIDATVDNNSWLNWKVQCTQNYTPGAENDFDCFPGLNYDGLTINEIHYNPGGGTNLEFIEIINHSNILMNLQDVAITGGIQYVFDDVLLPPKNTAPANYVVVAKDSTTFHNHYGFAPTGVYTGVLSNFGEEIKLQDLFANTIDSMVYRNGNPWDATASFGNHSLALLDPDLDNSEAASWCVQSPGFTPKGINNFNDVDGDTVPDCLDVCPGADDALVNTPCNDGDPCTVGESFDDNCNCTGGVFADADADGICDVNDQCAGFDDTIDLNNNGVPDGCEGCVDDIVEKGNLTITEDKSANKTILINGRVMTGSIDFHAGESVELTGDFEVQLGAVFHAYIEPCSN